MSQRSGDPRPAPVALGAVLGELTARRRWAQRLDDARIVERWEEVVGPHVASRTRVVRLAGGVLVVAVADPSWAQQVRFLEADVVARAAAVLGARPRPCGARHP